MGDVGRQAGIKTHRRMDRQQRGAYTQIKGDDTERTYEMRIKRRDVSYRQTGAEAWRDIEIDKIEG